MYKHVSILKKSCLDIKQDLKQIKDQRLKDLAKSNLKLLEQLIKQFQLTKNKTI